MTTITGTSGNDTLEGGPGRDILSGLAGNDELYGAGGADLIDGGPGRDIVGYLSTDEDPSATTTQRVEADLTIGAYRVGGVVSRVSNVESAYGGASADLLRGNGRANDFWAGPGNDRLYGLGGNDRLEGGEGADALYGGSGDDTLNGGYGLGTDILDGGFGNDLLLVDDASGDQVWGGPGADQFGLASISFPSSGGTIFSVRDFETSSGDVIDLRAYTVKFDGSDTSIPLEFIGQQPFAVGVSQVRYQFTSDDSTLVQFTNPNDSSVREVMLDGRHDLTADDFLLGFTVTPGDDTITGTRFADIVNGGDGSDLIKGLAGNDDLYGSDGDDDLNGGEGDDIVFGAEDNDFVYGGRGNDALYGDSGNDKLGGGLGVDVLMGGIGNDIFDVNPGDSRIGSGNRDWIVDFAKGDRNRSAKHRRQGWHPRRPSLLLHRQPGIQRGRAAALHGSRSHSGDPGQHRRRHRTRV